MGGTLNWIVSTFLSTERRKLKGRSLEYAKFLGFLMAAFYVYTGVTGVISPETHRGVFFAFSTALVFAWFPASKKSPADRITPWDGFLIFLSLFLGGYFIINYPQFTYRAGAYTMSDTLMGLLGIILSLEAARRGTGAPIPVMSLLMLVYASTWVGPNLPGLWGHKGYDLQRISAFLFTTTEGLFGTVVYTLASYVMPFVIFGAFMAASGVGRFFIDLPYSLFGTRAGGSAIVSVLAGLFMGFLNGSPVGTVLAVGAFLIPLMMRTGYDADTAGGIVSAACCGAMFTPPVMGAAAFFMVEFTGIPYVEIIEIAFWPALLYYAGLMVQVNLHARKTGMKGVPASELPDWRRVLADGWYMSLPLFVLVALLVLNYSPGISALAGSLCCVLVSLPKKKTRMSLRKFYETLALASRDIMIIGCVAGAIGIIIGLIGLSGLGQKFTTLLLALGGGNLLATVFFVALAASILGMGAPISAVYIILAVLVPPALVRLGVSVAAAHMTIMWFSQLSGLTPPVCLVAYAAAAMSGGNFFKTGFSSLKYGIYLIIVPLLFVYTSILEPGSPKWFLDYGTGFVAVFFFAAFMQGYWVRKNTLIENLLFGVGSLMLFTPYITWSIIGLVVCLGTWLWQFLSVARCSRSQPRQA